MAKAMRIYISGKITGLNLDTARMYFKTASEWVKAAGHTPINPMEVVPYQEHFTWADYMAEDVRILLPCDAILMLENWTDSKGARIQHAIAKEAGLQVIYAAKRGVDNMPLRVGPSVLDECVLELYRSLNKARTLEEVYAVADGVNGLPGLFPADPKAKQYAAELRTAGHEKANHIILKM